MNEINRDEMMMHPADAKLFNASNTHKYLSGKL